MQGIGHCSQNGQKLEDYVDGLVGPQQIHFSHHTQNADPGLIMYRQSGPRPATRRTSARNQPIIGTTGHSNSIQRVLIGRNTSIAAGSNSQKNSPKKFTPPSPDSSASSPNSKTGGSPDSPSTPDSRSSLGPSDATTPGSVFSTTAPLLSQDNVHVVEMVDGSRLIVPTKERGYQSMKDAGIQRAEARRKSVQNLYGNLEDPSQPGGYVHGFYLWCVAGPGVMVQGVLTDAEKQVYSCVPSAVICHEFFTRHFLLRPQYDRKDKTHTIKKTVGSSSVDNCIKALKALWDYQAACHKEGKDGYERDFGARPNSNKELSGLKNTHGASTAEERQAKHLPRGKASLAMEGYTRDQNRQLFEFGMTNESLAKMRETKSKLRKNKNKCRSLHTHHTLAHNCILRYDDRQRIRLSDFCCIDAPEEWGGDSKLLGIVQDSRKCNRDGKWETSYAARHRTDPKRCTFFAFSLELYSQIHLLGLELHLEDFVPKKIGACMYNHSWYDRFFFFGNTKATTGCPSRPDPEKMCHYDTTNKAFKTLYEEMEPPLRGHHVLHLQRGCSARMANAEGVALHEIANHGGWKAVSAMLNHYLIGVPMQFLSWAANWPSEINKDNPPVVLRNLLDPPEDLWTQVFPFFSHVQAVLDADKEKSRDAKSFPLHDDATILGFMELCEVAAKYFLQDCAVMCDSMSDHEIFSTPLLQSVEFFQFREDLLLAMAEHESKSKVSADANSNPSRSCCDGEVLKIVKDIYNRLTGLTGSPVLGDDWTVHQDEDVCLSALRQKTAQRDNLRSPSRFFGSSCPVEIGRRCNTLMSPMRQAQSPPKNVGCDLGDPATWPGAMLSGGVPTWAKNVEFQHQVPSPEILVQEYLVGYPRAPSVKALEECYGPKRSRSGDSWRGTRAKNKAYCCRKPLYDIIDQAVSQEAAVNALEMIIEDELHEFLINGLTAKNPGSVVMNKLFKLMAQKKDGFRERSAAARGRKRKVGEAE